MAARPEKKKVLITVRTYPTPAKRGVEVSCTAGIADGRWIRLFPIPFRFLDPDKRFKKYQWIEAMVRKATSDVRPESYHIDVDSIRVVSRPIPAGDWRKRRAMVAPLLAESLCELERHRKNAGAPTLGLFKPRAIEQLTIENDSSDWTPDQLATLRQGALFKDAPAAELQKVPYKFRYCFHCDGDACSGHALMCTDWEMGEAWRKWKATYGEAGWEAKFRQRFEREMIDKYDTHFYVGTVHGHPATWIIVGLFYPPRRGVSAQGTLPGLDVG